MHGATIKMVSAQQAKLTSNCKNTRLKLLKVNDSNPLMNLQTQHTFSHVAHSQSHAIRHSKHIDSRSQTNSVQLTHNTR